jgi:signal peptidase I
VTILLLLFGTTTLVRAFVIRPGRWKHAVDRRPSSGRQTRYAPAGPMPNTRSLTVRSSAAAYPCSAAIDIRQTFVKRVVGVPGDRLRIENKQVYLNGAKLNEPYKYHKTEYFDSYRDNFPGVPNVRLYEPAQVMLDRNVTKGEVEIPANSYFAMGDNRDSSLDSRYWGFVPRENIIGKPLIIWSYDATERLADPPSASTAWICSRTSS